MEVIHERVAGLDVHKDSVVACVRIMSGGKAKRECRTFRDDDSGAGGPAGLDHLVGMHAGGDGGDRGLLAADLEDPARGRVRDEHRQRPPHQGGPGAQDRHERCDVDRGPGRLRADQGELRARRRVPRAAHADADAQAARARSRTSHVQRIQKTLTEANIRLDSVISDIMGVNGRRMIEAIIEGVRDPGKLAALGDRRLKATRKELHDALHGRLTEHHRFLLKLHLDQHDALEKTIRVIDAEVERRIARLDKQAKPAETPLSRLIELLVSIPGVSYLSAITIISEIGSNMSRFPTAGHLIAWAGLCPGQNESAGKRKRSRLRKGAPWLKTMLVQCAWAAKRQKNSYYRAQFYRLQARRGPQKAICAVAASILTAIYHILARIWRSPSRPRHRLLRQAQARGPRSKRLVAQIAKLGFEATLHPDHAKAA